MRVRIGVVHCLLELALLVVVVRYLSVVVQTASQLLIATISRVRVAHKLGSVSRGRVVVLSRR